MFASAQWKAKQLKKLDFDVSKVYGSGNNKADEHSREAGASAQSSFALRSPYIWASHRRYHPHLRVCLPISNSIIQKIAHKYALRLVSWVTLDLVRLAVSINHHEGYW